MVFGAVSILQFNGNRMLPRILCRNVTDPMRSQIGMSVLKVRDLEFSEICAELIQHRSAHSKVNTKNLGLGRALLTPHTSPLHPGQRVRIHPKAKKDGGQLSNPKA